LGKWALVKDGDHGQPSVATPEYEFVVIQPPPFVFDIINYESALFGTAIVGVVFLNTSAVNFSVYDFMRAQLGFKTIFDQGLIVDILFIIGMPLHDPVLELDVTGTIDGFELREEMQEFLDLLPYGVGGRGQTTKSCRGPVDFTSHNHGFPFSQSVVIVLDVGNIRIFMKEWILFSLLSGLSRGTEALELGLRGFELGDSQLVGDISTDWQISKIREFLEVDE